VSNRSLRNSGDLLQCAGTRSEATNGFLAPNGQTPREFKYLSASGRLSSLNEKISEASGSRLNTRRRDARI